jgi:hypothetical protein
MVLVFGGFFSSMQKVIHIKFNIPYNNINDAKSKRMLFDPNEKLWYLMYKIPDHDPDFGIIRDDKRLKQILVDYEVEHIYCNDYVYSFEKDYVKSIIRDLKIEIICDQAHIPECDCLLDKHNTKCSKCRRVTRTGKLIL